MTRDTDHNLEPVTDVREPTLTFDFPGLNIGIAEYREGPTGCTVFTFTDEDGRPTTARCSSDVRGGSAGVLFPDFRRVNAICLAGGSLYGIEAASGVVAHLVELGGYSRRWEDIIAVNAAVCWDLDRDNLIYPDRELGRAAARTAVPNRFPLGRQGAGRNTTVGKGLDFRMGQTAGQGAAFWEYRGVKLLACTVVNAVGAVRDRTGKLVRGHWDGERHVELDEQIMRRRGTPQRGNTTLTVIVTNMRIEDAVRDQLARQIHSSMSRAIDPFHTMLDGDALFLVSTEESDGGGLTAHELGVIASDLVWEAVLSSWEQEHT